MSIGRYALERLAAEAKRVIEAARAAEEAIRSGRTATYLTDEVISDLEALENVSASLQGIRELEESLRDRFEAPIRSEVVSRFILSFAGVADLREELDRFAGAVGEAVGSIIEELGGHSSIILGVGNRLLICEENGRPTDPAAAIGRVRGEVERVVKAAKEFLEGGAEVRLRMCRDAKGNFGDVLSFASSLFGISGWERERLRNLEDDLKYNLGKICELVEDAIEAARTLRDAGSRLLNPKTVSAAEPTSMRKLARGLVALGDAAKDAVYAVRDSCPSEVVEKLSDVYYRALEMVKMGDLGRAKCLAIDHRWTIDEAIKLAESALEAAREAEKCAY
jgi:hypothetical protein